MKRPTTKRPITEWTHLPLEDILLVRQSGAEPFHRVLDQVRQLSLQKHARSVRHPAETVGMARETTAVARKAVTPGAAGGCIRFSYRRMVAG